MKTRRTFLAAALSAAALAVPASPAAATHDEPRCQSLVTIAPPDVEVEVCVTATGLYDPFEVQCNAIYGCWARVTAGTHSSASVEADVCVRVGTLAPLCVGTGTGAIPLVPVPPQTVCINDSPWGPPCVPHDG